MPKKRVREVKTKAKILNEDKKESKKIISLESSLEIKSEEAIVFNSESEIGILPSPSPVREISRNTNVESSQPQRQPKSDNNREFSFYDIKRQRTSAEAELKRSYNISMSVRSVNQLSFEGNVGRLTRDSQTLGNHKLRELSDEKERPYDSSLRKDTTRTEKKIYPWEM